MTKVLIAEDDHDIREQLVLTLQFHGFDVTSVEDGAAVVEIAHYNFDLILMDVRMPRMTGYEACKALKRDERTRDIPVIFVSAKGQEAEITTGLDAGACEYILKPWSPDKLISTINKTLGLNRLGVY